MQDIRRFPPNSIIDFKDVTMVAVRGDIDDWAAYWLPSSDASIDEVAHHGHKLTREAAMQLFPDIGGGIYRD